MASFGSHKVKRSCSQPSKNSLIPRQEASLSPAHPHQSSCHTMRPHWVLGALLSTIYTLFYLSCEGSPLLLNLEPSEKNSRQRWSSKGSPENVALDPVPRGLANRLPRNWQSSGPVTGNSEQGPASLQGLVLCRGAARNGRCLRAAAERARYVSQMNQSDNPLLGSWPEVKKWVERGQRCSPCRGPSSGKQVEREICVPPHKYTL